MDDAVSNPKIEKGWPGTSFNKSPADALDPDTGKNLKGIKVLRVFPESPADRAGMKTNDLIIAVYGEPFHAKSFEEVFSIFFKTVGERGPGGSMKMELLRDKHRFDVTARLISRPRVNVHLPIDPKREQAKPALVQDVLERGGLKDPFVSTLQAMRDKATPAFSPAVKKGKYNPFRLTAINRALYFSMEVPLVAQEIVDASAPASDLAGLVSAIPAKTGIGLAGWARVAAPTFHPATWAVSASCLIAVAKRTAIQHRVPTRASLIVPAGGFWRIFEGKPSSRRGFFSPFLKPKGTLHGWGSGGFGSQTDYVGQ